MANPYSLCPYAIDALAETIVFYDEVTVVGTRDEILTLINWIGSERFLRLCEARCVMPILYGGNGHTGSIDDSTIFTLTNNWTEEPYHLLLNDFEDALRKSELTPRHVAEKILTVWDDTT